MSNNKTLPLAGPVIVALGIFAGWVTWGLARMGSKNAQPGPFITTALITLVVIAGLGVLIGHLRQKSTTPKRTGGSSIVKMVAAMVAIVVVLIGLSVLITLLAVGVIKITLPPFWWAVIWGAVTGTAIAIALLVHKATVARATMVRN